MLNVHTLGGSDMMKRTVEAVRLACEKEKIARPLVIGVTILTSSTDEVLDEKTLTAKPRTLVGIWPKSNEGPQNTCITTCKTLIRRFKSAGASSPRSALHNGRVPSKMEVNTAVFALTRPGLPPTRRAAGALAPGGDAHTQAEVAGTGSGYGLGAASPLPV